MARQRPAFLAAFALLVLPMAAAFAQSANPEKFSLSLGVFVAELGSRTTLNASSGDTGTDVDLEGDLGLRRSSSVFRVDGYYKFNENHRIDLSWFDLSRSSTRQIKRDIEWNDTVFPIDTTVSSAVDFGVYKAAYTWSFLRQERNFLGATAGLYIADIGTSLRTENQNRREVASATAPLPVLGLRGQYYFAEKWSFRASGEFFLFSYEDWDGDLMDLQAGIDYQFSDNFAIGLGVNFVSFDLGVTKSNFSGALDWGYTGGLIFLRGSF